MKREKLLSIILFFEFFIIYPPEYFKLNHIFSLIINIFLILLFLICFLCYIKFIYKNGISKIFGLICIFWIIFLLSTIIHGGGSLTTAIKPIISTFIICSSFDMCRNYRYNFLKTFSIYLGIIIFINFIIVIIFPKGLYFLDTNINPHFFLGHRNNSIEYMIPSICSCMLINYMNNKKHTIFSIILFIISFLTVIFTWSANAILVMAFLTFTLLLPTEKIIPKILNAKNFFITYLIGCIMIIVYRMQWLFKWLIVDILHKSLDFTYRTYIWDRAIKWIKKSPIIGYGYEDEILKKYKIIHGNSCHNYILDFLYMGGIIAVIVIFTCLILIFKKLKENNTRASLILNYILCGYFILWFATPIHINTLSLMFLVFMFAYNIDSFKTQKQ